MNNTGQEGLIKKDSGWAFLIWTIPLVLSIFGVVMIGSLSLRNSVVGGNPYSMPIRQGGFLGIGLVGMYLISVVSLDKVRSKGFALWFFAVLLMLITSFSGLGVSVGGARRWLNIGFMRFQPLEFLLFAIPLCLSDRLTSVRRKDLQAFLRPTLLILIFSIVPMLGQHMGGTMLVAAICLLMHAENRGWKYPLWSILAGILLASLMIIMAPYRMRRLEGFLHPWDDPQGKGYQIIQGLIAFANGGLFGLGIGKGLQEARYLPAAQTDYIFAAVGEEFGLVGTITVLAFYAGWTYRIYKMYRSLDDPFLSNLTLGLTASIICPLFVNFAGVTKMMPLTGIPMPFLSAGGSSMLFMWLKVGLLVSINQYNQTMQDKSNNLVPLPLKSPKQPRALPAHTRGNRRHVRA